MKTKFIGFRADPETARQIQAEAQRRGLTVSAYVRLQAMGPLVEAGPPDARPLNQELKSLIAEGHDVRPGDRRAEVEHFLRSIDAVIAAQSTLTDTVRWLINAGQMQQDLDPDARLSGDSFRRAADTVIRVQGQLDTAARQLLEIGQTMDRPTPPTRRKPDARA